VVKIPKQKILILDIEWRPTLAYVWGAWQQNIYPEQIKEHGGLLCVGAKWLGDKETFLFSEWEHGHEGMLAKTHEMMSYADAVIGFNSDKYDIRKLEGEFAIYRLPPPPQVTSIDLIKTIKKFGLFMNRLAFVGPLLKVGKKLENSGMPLWTAVIDGDEKAQEKMSRYCKQDVKMTEALYLRIRPYIRNHPHLGQAGKNECGACGSKNTQSRGTRRTRVYKIQRICCNSCGSWSDGKRTKL
jgi:hypothetical protein